MVLDRCKVENLVLNWEKCHFIVCEGIVLGHRVSKEGLEVNKVKISTIENLTPLMNVKGVRSFLSHDRFYRRIIKDFSKIVRPSCRLLEKDTTFVFDKAYRHAFIEIKKRLISTSIIIAPDWNIPFDIMCDASDFAIGVVMEQRHEKMFRAIYYASRSLNEA